MKDIADGRATKIFVPSDISSVVSSLGTIGETLGIGDAEKIDHSARAIPAPAPDPCIDEETGRGGVEAAKSTQTLNRDIEQISANDLF